MPRRDRRGYLEGMQGDVSKTQRYVSWHAIKWRAIKWRAIKWRAIKWVALIKP